MMSEYDYEELKHDYEELAKENSTLKYLRDLCDRQQKVLDILRNSPFILEVLFSQNIDKKYNKKYMWGTITEEEKETIIKWIVK